MTMIEVDEKKLDQILVNISSLCDSFYSTVNGKGCHGRYCEKNCPFLCDVTIKEWLRKEDDHE